MAQTVVPVYTIPNTYWVQQSLWESMCQIIPGIARTNEGNVRPFQPTARGMPARQTGTAPVTGNSGDCGTVAAPPANPPNTAAAPTRTGSTTQDTKIVGIPPTGSIWANFHLYDPDPEIPTIDLTSNGDAPAATPQGTDTPVSAGPVLERRLSKKNINVPKVEAFHLISAMQDRQERARQSAETECQTPSSRRSSVQGRGSIVGLPHGLLATLPNLLGGLSSVPSSPTPEVPKRGTKHPQDEDVEELPDEGEPAGPPKKRKKKKKSKSTTEDEVPPPGEQPDQAQPSTSTAEPPEDTGDLAPAMTLEESPAKEHKNAKKKKKKHKEDASQGKLTQEQRVARAKEIAKAKHRPLQRKHDYKAVRTYRKSLTKETLETINGVDHSAFLLGKLHEAGNYMSQKTGHERNLMSVAWLLSQIAKYADEPQKWLTEAQTVTKSTFSMVQGMPTADKCSPEVAVRVLMDCSGAVIDCNHREYGKEQNMGLHDVIHPATMARVMARETYDVEGIPTTIKVDHAYCPFCAYAAANHRAVNNHVWMHFRAILVCGWPGCFFVDMQSLKMIEHSSEVHGMARAKPCRDKKE